MVSWIGAELKVTDQFDVLVESTCPVVLVQIGVLVVRGDQREPKIRARPIQAA